MEIPPVRPASVPHPGKFARAVPLREQLGDLSELLPGPPLGHIRIQSHLMEEIDVDDVRPEVGDPRKGVDGAVHRHFVEGSGDGSETLIVGSCWI